MLFEVAAHAHIAWLTAATASLPAAKTSKGRSGMITSGALALPPLPLDMEIGERLKKCLGSNANTAQRGFLEFNGQIECVRVCRVRMLNK